MHWFFWFLVGFQALGALMTINSIGKPRTPTTPGVGAFGVAVSAAIIVGILWAGGAFA